MRQVDDRQDGGQTLVEFALVVPIFMLVIFGRFDVGRAVYANSVLSQGAREGARLAATELAGSARLAEHASAMRARSRQPDPVLTYVRPTWPRSRPTSWAR